MDRKIVASLCLLWMWKSLNPILSLFGSCRGIYYGWRWKDAQDPAIVLLAGSSSKLSSARNLKQQQNNSTASNYSIVFDKVRAVLLILSQGVGGKWSRNLIRFFPNLQSIFCSWLYRVCGYIFYGYYLYVSTKWKRGIDITIPHSVIISGSGVTADFSLNLYCLDTYQEISGEGIEVAK
jgi:hypothetical protein